MTDTGTPAIDGSAAEAPVNATAAVESTPPSTTAALTETRAEAGIVTQAISNPEVAPAPAPAEQEAIVQQAYSDMVASEVPTPAPVLEPSLLQKTEDAVVGAVHAVEAAVESGIEHLATALHLGTHGEAAAAAAAAE